jgi:hypothetical protein
MREFTPRLPWPNRLWDNIDNSGGDDACWPWLGSINGADGYGQVTLEDGYVQERPAAVVLRLTKGPPPTPYHETCHTCDVRHCCNYRHLYWGTSSQNSRDAFARGRRNNQGMQHPSAKLTDDDVRGIRRERRAGVPGVVVAARYNVSPQVVSAIHKGKAWTHVPD